MPCSVLALLRRPCPCCCCACVRAQVPLGELMEMRHARHLFSLPRGGAGWSLRGAVVVVGTGMWWTPGYGPGSWGSSRDRSRSSAVGSGSSADGGPAPRTPREMRPSERDALFRHVVGGAIRSLAEAVGPRGLVVLKLDQNAHTRHDREGTETPEPRTRTMLTHAGACSECSEPR